MPAHLEVSSEPFSDEGKPACTHAGLKVLVGGYFSPAQEGAGTPVESRRRARGRRGWSMRCLLTRCFCSERTKREDLDGEGDGDSLALSSHGGVELSDGLSSKARGKQPVSSRLSSGEAFLSDTPIAVKSVALKLRRAAADLPFGMTINGSRNRVTEVLPGSPADASGVRIFDVVLKVDGTMLGDERLSAVLQGQRGRHCTAISRSLAAPLASRQLSPPFPRRQARGQAEARAARAEQLRSHRCGRDAPGRRGLGRRRHRVCARRPLVPRRVLAGRGLARRGGGGAEPPRHVNRGGPKCGKCRLPWWHHSSLPWPPGADSPGARLRYALGTSLSAAQGPMGGYERYALTASIHLSTAQIRSQLHPSIHVSCPGGCHRTELAGRERRRDTSAAARPLNHPEPKS